MRHLILLLSFLASSFLAAPGFSAEGAQLSAADRASIRQVVEKQLDAFQRDDAVEAFSYATPSIQAQFGNPADFIRMVRTAYEAVYRPRATLFLDAFVTEDFIVQPVQVVAPDGTVMIAFYTMERQPGGEWRIAGCVLGRARGEAA